jgi:hypothetical protein
MNCKRCGNKGCVLKSYSDIYGDYIYTCVHCHYYITGKRKKVSRGGKQ